MKEKQFALFIHGFGGSGESSTGKCVEKALCQKYDFIKPDFDLTDVNGTLSKIREIINNPDPRVGVCRFSQGSDFIGFNTLAN